MKTMLRLHLSLDGEGKVIHFGIPSNDGILDEMYRLRYMEYSRRGYIATTSSKIDKDEYDEGNKCSYFIAVIDGNLIGTVRLIRDYYLPTEKQCFSFREPDAIKGISRDQRGEIGRLIVTPYYWGSQYLPRNIVMLCLIRCLIQFGDENNVLGGYAFIKENLERKLGKLRVPFHKIQPYTKIYPKNGLLSSYFNDPTNDVVPIYYLRDEVRGYIDRLFENKRMFRRVGNDDLLLRDSFYNMFLSFLKII